MKNLRWQIVIVVLALIAIGILLIGQQPASLLPGAQTTVLEPGQGGVYTEALIGTFGRLNPVLDYYNNADRSIDRLLYRGLVQFNDRGLPEDDLAESWGISQDGKIYNFSIRSDAIWHDGQPVTSSDVAFTVGLLRDENIPLPSDLREFWNQVEVFELDEQTVQFQLPEAFAPFMDYVSFGLLPRHIWEGVPTDQIIDSPLNLQPVGNGPLKFDKLIVEDEVVTGVELVGFADYPSPPYLEKLIFKYYPDSQAAWDAYQKGDVQGISEVTPAVLPAALQDDTLSLHTGQVPRLGLVYLNLDKPELPFFQDADLRRALLQAINRQRIIDQIQGGQAIIADGPIMPGTWSYYEGIERIPFNPEQALTVLKDAGYTIPPEGGSVRAKEGVQLSFELAYPDQEPYASIARSIQQDWAAIGVGVTLKAVPFEQLLQDYLEPGNYQAVIIDLNLGRTPDPDPYPFWHQSQIEDGQNYSRWDDRQASEYLEQGRVLVDTADRTKRYRNFQVRFTNQMPALPMYYLVQSFALENQMQGVSVGTLFDQSDRFNTITNWYLVTKRPVAVTETQITSP